MNKISSRKFASKSSIAAVVALAISMIGGVAAAQSLPTAPSQGPGMQQGMQQGMRHGRGHGRHAQQGPAVQFAPAAAQGTVARFAVGPMGRVRAMVLDNGSVVMLGHDSESVATRAGIGSRVRVQGYASPQAATTIVGATIYDASGNVLSQPNPRQLARLQNQGPNAVPGQPGQPGQAAQPGVPGGWHEHDGEDDGHEGRDHARGEHQGRRHGGQGPQAQGHRGGQGQRGAMMARIAQMPARSAQGTVQTLIAGPRGHVRAVLLNDGTTVTFDRQIAQAAQAQGLAVGQVLRVQGHGEQYARGVAVMAQSVTFANGVTAASMPRVHPAAGAPGMVRGS